MSHRVKSCIQNRLQVKSSVGSYQGILRLAYERLESAHNTFSLPRCRCKGLPYPISLLDNCLILEYRQISVFCGSEHSVFRAKFCTDRA